MTSYLVYKRISLNFLLCITLFSCDSGRQKKKVSLPITEKKNSQEINYIFNDTLASSELGEAELIQLQNILDSVTNQLMENESVRGIAVQCTDLASNKSIQINPELKFVPASLLKIPILIAVLKLEEISPGSLKEIIPLRNVNPGQIDMNLEENYTYQYSDTKVYTTEELCEIMMTHSDNVATYSLLVYLDSKKPGLLQKVEKDLKASIPETASNRDDIVQIGHFAEMFRVLYHADYLNQENSIKALRFLSKSRYGQGFRKSIPNSINMAHKYGVRFNVDEINPLYPVQLHQVALVYHSKHPFVLSVMSKGRNIEDLRLVLQTVSRIVFNRINQIP